MSDWGLGDVSMSVRCAEVVYLCAAEAFVGPAAEGTKEGCKCVTVRRFARCIVYGGAEGKLFATETACGGFAAKAFDVVIEEGRGELEAAYVVGDARAAGCLVAESGGVGVPIETAGGVGQLSLCQCAGA